MQIEAIFFDFDGVIADTETVWFDGICKFCRERSVPVSQRELMDYLGDGDVMMMRLVSQRSGLGEEEIVRDLHEAFVRATESLELRPGISEYLEYVRAAGLKCALVSNSDSDYIEKWLVQLGIKNRFDCVVTRDCGLAIKPAPDLYRAALSQLELRAERVLAIEDSVIGLRAALAAGLHTIAYPNACSCQDVEAFGAPSVDLGRIHPAQLLERLESFRYNVR